MTPYAEPRRDQPGDDVPAEDLDNPLPSSTAELPCPQAIEFLAGIHVEKMVDAADADAHLEAARQLYTSLAKEYDPMRQRCVSLVTCLKTRRRSRTLIVADFGNTNTARLRSSTLWGMLRSRQRRKHYSMEVNEIVQCTSQNSLL